MPGGKAGGGGGDGGGGGLSQMGKTDESPAKRKLRPELQHPIEYWSSKHEVREKVIATERAACSWLRLAGSIIYYACQSSCMPIIMIH